MRKRFYIPFNTNIEINADFSQEPMRRNRFFIHFPENLNIPEYSVQRADLPHYNLQNMSWEEMSMDLVDLYGNGVSSKASMMNLINYCKNKRIQGDDDLFTIRMSNLDPTGVVIETFVITVNNIRVKFGILDYGSDDMCSITLTIKPTCCVIE